MSRPDEVTDFYITFEEMKRGEFDSLNATIKKGKWKFVCLEKTTDNSGLMLRFERKTPK